ncbi:hypothetical protein EZS27_020146 [termite gut metagenome]|uniref:7-cyano-7-deazaguanine synthase n=1 Tax=termite gut metagenome TaxID=433724 RepID=A0A5J4RB99_9ZZZZ
MVTRIEIELREPLKRGKFDDVILHLYKEDKQYNININFDFTPLYSFARDKESIAFDFLFFSVLIYNIDRFVNRHIFSLEGWTREIEVINIPVMHLNEFQLAKGMIDEAISFLTGDIWNINYSQSEGILYQSRDDIKDWGNINIYEKVCLFSGGLDSLIGIIDELERIQQGKLLLISHKDLGKEGTDQDSIMTIFAHHHLYENKYSQIQTSVGIGKKNVGLIGKEPTFRSRSLLFIGMGIYAAYNIGTNTSLIIPENGTIALNIPLIPSRRSACSTRTTHPTFMNRLQSILTNMEITNYMYNPYELKTKGEMIMESLNQDILRQLIDASCSCAKRSHTYYWDNRGNCIKHCGMCLPCIYRRVSLHVNGLDNDVSNHYGTDVFNGIKFDINHLSQKSSRAFRTLLDFIRRRPSIEQIEKELLINGMCDVSRIRDYALVVNRTIEQIIDWINASNNTCIKRKVNLI